MECLKNLEQGAKRLNYSSDMIARRRQAMCDAVEASRRDPSVVAMFLHGQTPTRVRAQGARVTAECYQPDCDTWEVFHDTARSPAAMRSAIDLAQRQYPMPPYPISLAQNAYYAESVHAHTSDDSSVRQECLDLCRSHLESGGTRAMLFVASFAERLIKTESTRLREKGQRILRLCADPAFLQAVDDIAAEVAAEQSAVAVTAGRERS